VNSANPGSHATAQQADVFMVCLRVNFCQRNLGHYRILTEGGASHVVVKRLAIVRKAGGSVRHQSFSLSFANRYTEVRFPGLTEFTLPAFGGVKRNHMVSRLHAGHAFTDLHDDTGPFVAENHRENALRIVPGEGKGIGVADTGVGIFNQHLAFLGGATSISTISRASWCKCNGST
jgi:hypothetical protein